MSLDHLDKLAAAAGFAGVPDDIDEVTALRPARVRFATPDAPAPRRLLAAAETMPTAVVALTVPQKHSATTVARAAVTSYVGTALRTAQGLVATRRATA